MNPSQIVLIEDNPDDVYLIEMAMKEKGIPFSLTRFETGLQAVEALNPDKGWPGVSPDLILLDLNTPRTNGFEALRRLKANRGLTGVPIAILSTSRARADKLRAAEYGVPYIEKPCHLYEFLESVGNSIEQMLSAGCIEAERTAKAV